MLLNRNRKDGNPEIANKATVYLDGIKQERCIEASTPGVALKGQGYVIRQDTTQQGFVTEKVYGLVEIKL